MNNPDVSVVNIVESKDNQSPSTSRVCELFSGVRTRYVCVITTPYPTYLDDEMLGRMVQVAIDTDASILYTDYCINDGELRKVATDDYSSGSVRDDFDMGPLLLIKTETALNVLAGTTEEYKYAGLYDLRLRISQIGGNIAHLPEPLPIVTLPQHDGDTAHKRQFGYVDSANADVQKEMEHAFTHYLKATGALLTAEPKRIKVNETDWPVVASIVIPVFNRKRTIADAIHSALSQTADFKFNVLVVDNYSTDGTSEIIDEISATDDRLVHIYPRLRGHGIGGCWNEALTHSQCGAYAVQLDSDDIYSDSHTLTTIVEKFRATDAAMVVGSYKLCNFNLELIPPGIIAHREWTSDNGRNNLLRINGIGAPRAFATEVAREFRFPDVSYGEDYAMALRMSRTMLVERIYEPLYICRRWDGNSDSNISDHTIREHNRYKDAIRGIEISARRNLTVR